MYSRPLPSEKNRRRGVCGGGGDCVQASLSNQCTKSSKIITFNFKLLHRRLPTNCFLKKVGLRDDDKCSFCNKETENLIHLFWRCEKTKNFWDSLFKWMQSCQLSLGEHNYLHINTALGLRPDRSKHKLQINFCCLITKLYIWLCRSKEQPPNLNNFLLYLKHIYQIENNASTVKNKWEPLVALYKPFDLSLQNLIKYTYLLYISFLVLFGFDCALLPKEKKGNERAGREKGKHGPDVSTSLFAFSLLLSSQLMLCLLLDVC